MNTKPTRPIPPEVKAANRQRALALAAQAPAPEDRPPVFAHWMRDVFLPHYRELLAEQRQDGAA
ncbi:hypothetical protein [uncultured Gordonia sp.]|uniref:hypothetical protein n=1 Tax=uncultured Gordonia sp. TaxID=198437 RepID=UPI0025870D21|nr:hypothetical protein [uncultured Gordonia sp.]